jgi:N-acetylglucosamine kinase-like BadF-type ATPase
VASCGKLVFELYAKGSPTAKALLEETADEIALAITTAAQNDSHPKPLPAVFSGSLVQPGRALYPMLEERLLKEGSPISMMCGLEAHPAAAAAALALHARGLDEAGDRLLQQAKGVLL